MTRKASKNGDLLASLHARRDFLVAKIEEGERAKALVVEIDATLAKLVELVRTPAKDRKQPSPRTEPIATPSATKPGRFQTGYGAAVLVILKRTPGQPVRARDLAREVARNTDPPITPGTPEYKTLDVSVRNAILNLHRDATTGVTKLNYGHYRWDEPMKEPRPED